MTTRQSAGGRIPPDGRQPAPPGVGKSARRHDLEQPATPGLAGSDLQQGDVQRLEQAQQVAPIKSQQPNPGRAARAQSGGSGGGEASASGGAPDPLQFALKRFGGTRGTTSAGGRGMVANRLDSTAWLPFLETLAASPRASVGATQAFIAQLSNAMATSPNPRSHVLDMQALDAAVEAGLNE